MRGGDLPLIVKLLKIKKEHTRELKIYNDAIKLFPQLEYSKLEECSNCNESLAYRTHIVRLLGDMIIRDNAKRFSGIIKLRKAISQAKSECGNIKIICPIRFCK